MKEHLDEFRRGWRVLVAASLGVALGAWPVAFHSIGPLSLPISDELGWGRGAVQFALFLFNLSVVIFVPIVSGIADRVGLRKVAIAALAAFGCLFASLALVPDSLYAFYALWILIGALGGFSTPVSWSRGVVGWFERGRGLALAVALTGTGLTAAFLPALTTWLIGRVGWRLTFPMIALLPLAVAMPVVIAWFREPRGQVAASGVDPARASTAKATLSIAIRDYRFFVLAISSLLVGVAMGGAVANFVPILVDHAFDRQEAANVAGVIGVTIIVGRIGMGYLIDRYWAPGIAAPVLLGPAIACLILAGPQVAHEHAIVAAVLIGLAAGAEADLIAFLTAKYFGLVRYARIYAVQYGVFALSAGIAPFLFGLAYDRFQVYRHVLIVAATMSAVGAVLLLSLGRYPVARSSSDYDEGPGRVGSVE